MADPPRPATPPVTGDDATLVAADAPLASSATILDRRTAGRAAARPEATIQGRRRGDALGRYVLLDELGRGGMGVVYAAYDPELERKVAVKLLQGGGGETSGRAWLAREAQAMAQLAHPNVVAIHDVGTVDGQLYIAMEHVEGETLAAWLAADRRSLREILAVFLQAGEGLQAAHAAGLVHRDFKPKSRRTSPERP